MKLKNRTPDQKSALLSEPKYLLTGPKKESPFCSPLMTRWTTHFVKSGLSSSRSAR
ncbi:hypothetical protein [Terriglobus aquaticus]|uniref:Uncharacterized protein n=1 Tax=Terriglobus aquaticus TaxID=940139 RepID=A0ABW9KJ93_9BACT|nr:hypothetical protein [Terriglobus aquaticus]